MLVLNIVTRSHTKILLDMATCKGRSFSELTLDMDKDINSECCALDSAILSRFVWARQSLKCDCEVPLPFSGQQRKKSVKRKVIDAGGNLALMTGKWQDTRTRTSS